MKGDGRCMAGAWLANERGGREGGKEGTEGRADDEWPGNPDRICPTDPTERDSPVALESTIVHGFSNGFASIIPRRARVLQ